MHHGTQCTSLLGKMQPTSIYLRCQYFETKFCQAEENSSILQNAYSSDAFLIKRKGVVVFFRHAVPCPVASEVEVEPNYSQEYQVSQKLIAASKAASEAVTAAALTTFQIPI